MATKSGKSKKAGRNSDWCKSYKLREQRAFNKGLELLNHFHKHDWLDVSHMKDGTITVEAPEKNDAYLAWAKLSKILQAKCLRAWMDRRKVPVRAMLLEDAARNLFAAEL